MIMRIDIEEVECRGNRDRANRRITANGNRITADELDSIRHRALRMECFSNCQVNGVYHFYSVAVMPD